MGVAETDEAGAFGMLDETAFETHGTQLVGFSPRESHRQVLS
jgi:hypothetical protein